MNPLNDGTSAINIIICSQSKAGKISSSFHPWHSGQPFPTISPVYLIMAGVEVPRQSGKVKASLRQPAGRDVNLQMSLALYILNASFVKQHRCRYKFGVVFL